MTATPPPAPDAAPEKRSRAATMSLYLAIGALIAAAALGGFFIIVGDQANIAGRAWLTLLLVALFAGAVVLDAFAARGPNRWYLGVSTIVNVVLVAIGLLKLWNGWLQPEDTAAASVWLLQMLRLLMIIAVLRLAVLFTQLYGLHFVTRARTQLGKLVSVLTVGLVWATALVLAAPAAFPAPAWPDWWWRIAGATTLVAVVTTVIPLIMRAFEPRAPKPPKPVVQQPAYYAQQVPGYYGQVPGQPAPGPVVQPIPPGYPQAAPGVPPVPTVPEAPQAAAPAAPDTPTPPQ